MCRMIEISLVLMLLLGNVSLFATLNRVKRIVGGLQAAQPPQDEPIVFLRKHDQDATVLGSRDQQRGFYMFRGIRYAEPPVGQHRFQRPRFLPLEGEINATKPGAPCPQPNPRVSGSYIGDEDCLFLNVFTPNMPDDSEGLPVLVWIHGGGFRHGSASQYGAKPLMRKNVILVTIQYRLGALGFLGTGTKDLPGNAAMFDMAASLKWVEDYIEFFGGNKKKIVSFGQGSGASSAMFLSLSKITKGMLSGVIAMSGSVLSGFALDRAPQTTAQNIAELNKCPTAPVEAMVACLQQIDVRNLIVSDDTLQRSRIDRQSFMATLSGTLGIAPVVESHDDQRSLPGFLTDGPEDLLKLGKFANIPLLTGVTQDETASAILGRFQNDVIEKIKAIPDFLENNFIENLISSTGLHSFLDSGLLTNGLEKLSFLKSDLPTDLKKSVSMEALSNINSVLEKVTEATGDGLFNLPAFLTAEHWGKKAPAYLYRFQHKGRAFKGRSFLAGLPLIGHAEDHGDDESSTRISHGDDLAYLFDPLDLFGNPINNPTDGDEDITDEEDDHVRDIFTDIISQFATNSKIEIHKDISDGINEMFGKMSMPLFNEKDNSYLAVTSKPKLLNDFRYCQMALWGAIAQTLKTASCKFLEVNKHLGEEISAAGSNIAKALTNNNTLSLNKLPSNQLVNSLNFLNAGAVAIPIKTAKVKQFDDKNTAKTFPTLRPQLEISKKKIGQDTSIFKSIVPKTPNVPLSIFG